MLKVHDRKLGNVAFLCMQGQIVNGETISTPKAFHNSAQGSTLGDSNRAGLYPGRVYQTQRHQEIETCSYCLTFFI